MHNSTQVVAEHQQSMPNRLHDPVSVEGTCRVWLPMDCYVFVVWLCPGA